MFPNYILLLQNSHQFCSQKSSMWFISVCFDYHCLFRYDWYFPSASVVKNPPANAGDTVDLGSMSGWGRSPGGENGNSLQYPCLENPWRISSSHRRAWRATVRGVAKSQALLSEWTTKLWLKEFCCSFEVIRVLILFFLICILSPSDENSCFQSHNIYIYVLLEVFKCCFSHWNTMDYIFFQSDTPSKPSGFWSLW